LLIALATFSINIGASRPAAASEILFLARQFPCFGATIPLTCLPGAPGSPVLWHGPNYVPVDLPANSLIEEIDLWGDSAQAVGIWDSTTPNFPFASPIPSHEVATIAPGSTDMSFSLFGVDGINGAQYFFLQQILHAPIFLQEGGRYYVGVVAFGLAGNSAEIYHTSAFMTDVDPATLSKTIPGEAIQVVGQVVPEPSTLGLVALGIMLLCLRRADMLHLPHR
jgi:hypothetical protein